MKHVVLGAVGTVVVGLSLGAQTQPPQRPKPAVSHPQSARASTVPTQASSNDAAQNALIKQNCVGCHNDNAKTGGLTRASFGPAPPEENPAVAVKIIHPLRLRVVAPP